MQSKASVESEHEATLPCSLSHKGPSQVGVLLMAVQTTSFTPEIVSNSEILIKASLAESQTSVNRETFSLHVIG